jgi:hypothetical protein
MKTKVTGQAAWEEVVNQIHEKGRGDRAQSELIDILNKETLANLGSLVCSGSCLICLSFDSE